MHVRITVQDKSLFPVCGFCTVQHFLLTFTKLNRSAFHFPFKVLLLLSNSSLNYEGQPPGFIDQAWQKFHKQQINGTVIMVFSLLVTCL